MGLLHSSKAAHPVRQSVPSAFTSLHFAAGNRVAFGAVTETGSLIIDRSPVRLWWLFWVRLKAGWVGLRALCQVMCCELRLIADKGKVLRLKN